MFQNEKAWILAAMVLNVVVTITGITVVCIVVQDDPHKITVATMIGGFGTTLAGILFTAYQNAKHTDLCHATQDMVKKVDDKAADAAIEAASAKVEAKQAREIFEQTSEAVKKIAKD